MTKAVILARVSTLKQEKEGLSVKDIQLPELRYCAAKRDFEVVKCYITTRCIITIADGQKSRI